MFRCSACSGNLDSSASSNNYFDGSASSDDYFDGRARSDDYLDGSASSNDYVDGSASFSIDWGTRSEQVHGQCFRTFSIRSCAISTVSSCW